MASPDTDEVQGSASQGPPLDDLVRPPLESFRFKEWRPGSINPQIASPIIDAFPGEIRPQIWKHLVGNRVLHPAKDLKKMTAIWKYQVCINERSPQELYDLSRTPDTHVHKLDGFEINVEDVPWKEKDDNEKKALIQSLRSAEFGHHDCRRKEDDDTDRSIGFIRRTDKTFSSAQAILQTCKLFHDEIIHTFWSTNIFSFFDRRTWSWFKTTLTGPEADLIRVIDFSLHTGELLNPLDFFSRIDLSGLQVLHIHLQDSRNNDFEENKFDRTVTAARSLFSRTELWRVRITVIVDNASHGRCRCHLVPWRIAPLPSLPLTQKECLKFADTLARRIPLAQLKEPSLASETADAKIPSSASRQMYVCLEGSTRRQCNSSYQRKLDNLTGKPPICGVEFCGAKHQCLVCKKREGIMLLYTASWHCRKPGGCDVLGGYTNPYVMPVEKFEKIGNSKSDAL